jgi:hypothetical protein
LWETNARYAAEEIAGMQAITWKTLPENTAKAGEFLAHAV